MTKIERLSPMRRQNATSLYSTFDLPAIDVPRRQHIQVLFVYSDRMGRNLFQEVGPNLSASGWPKAVVVQNDIDARFKGTV